jgi:hypothetical protein
MANTRRPIWQTTDRIFMARGSHSRRALDQPHDQWGLVDAPHLGAVRPSAAQSQRGAGVLYIGPGGATSRGAIQRVVEGVSEAITPHYAETAVAAMPRLALGKCRALKSPTGRWAD